MKRQAVLLMVIAAPMFFASAQIPATLLQQAQAGDVQAQIQVGNRYAFGQGVPRDPDRAMEWFKKAADKGSAEGQYRLGGMYDVGRISKQAPETAITWYTMAAKQNYPDAEYRLGVMYEQGRGVQADYITAGKWYLRAAEHGRSLCPTCVFRGYCSNARRASCAGPKPSFIDFVYQSMAWSLFFGTPKPCSYR